MIWLTVCIGVDYDSEMIPHLLKHYYKLGISKCQFLLVLHSRSELSSELLLARNMLRAFGIQPKDIWVGEYESREKQRRIKEVLDKNVKEEDWVIHCDADEFHEYPESIHTLTKKLDKQNINVVQGPLIDRITKGGILRHVLPKPKIWEQFPVECNIGGKILGLAKREEGNVKHKVLMYRGYLRANHGSGKISKASDSKANYFKSNYKIHHFKWTADVLRRLDRRIHTYKRLKYDWWIESQKFIDYYAKYGRIRLEDVT